MQLQSLSDPETEMRRPGETSALGAAGSRVLYADPRAMLDNARGGAPVAGWPVSDAEFVRISDAVFDTLRRLIDSADADRRDLLLIDSRFVVLLIQHLHAALVSQRCGADAVDIRRSAQSAAYYAPDWEALAGDYSRLPETPRSRLKRGLTPAVKRALYNKARIRRRPLRALHYGVDAVALGSHSSLREQFLEENDLFCGFPNADDLVRSGRTSGAPVLRAEIHAALNDLSLKLGNDLGIRFDSAPVGEAWSQRLADIDAALARIPVRSIPARVLVGELGNPRHRIFAVAARRKGAAVTGFHHGNSAMHFLSKWFGFVEPAICTEFICPTAEMARSYRASFELSGLQQHVPVSFGAVAKSPYVPLRRQLERVPPPDSIKKVMVIGFPWTAQRYLDSPADFFSLQLDIERQVSELLRQSGYTALYKAHPEHAAAARELQSGAADDIIAARFEDVWPTADAFVFCCTTSTTFGFALMTNKPVIVLDIEGAAWNPQVYEPLKSRCRMVPAHFDARNILRFDPARLLSALADVNGALNTDYVTKFML